MGPLEGSVESLGAGPAYVAHQFVGVTADVGALSSKTSCPQLVAPVLSKRAFWFGWVPTTSCCFEVLAADQMSKLS